MNGAFGEKTVECTSEYVDFVLNAEVDEVCVEQDVVRRSQCSVVLKEKRRVEFGDVSHSRSVGCNRGVLLCSTLLDELRCGLVEGEARVIGRDAALHGGEGFGLLGFALCASEAVRE